MKTRILQIYLIAAILWGMISCAPKAIIVEPIAPAVVKAHGDVKAAAASKQVPINAAYRVTGGGIAWRQS